MSDARARVSRRRLVLAFAAVYLIWGSTYLAIRWTIEDVPPFLMAGARNLLAGLLLFAGARWRGAALPTAREWGEAALLGALLLGGGQGAVTWSQLRVPSGLAALIVATMPLWMALLQHALPGEARPSRREVLGIALGFLGVALLIGPARLLGGVRPDPLGVAVLLGGSISWALGSLRNRRVPQPASPLLATGMQALCGGALLVLLGLAAGEPQRFDSSAVGPRALLAFLYLVVFGSIVGFTAFVWLLRVTTPARVSTYAYVNPVVALLLGWALAGEPLPPRTMIAAAAVVGAVAMITSERGRLDTSAPRG